MDPSLSSPGMRRDGVILPIVKKRKKKRVTHAIISRDNLARLGHGQVMRRWDFLCKTWLGWYSVLSLGLGMFGQLICLVCMV